MFQVGDILASPTNPTYVGRVIGSDQVEILNKQGHVIIVDDLSPAAIQWWGWVLGSGVPNGATALAVCQHHVVDVGFRFSKFVCKKCDKEIKVG